MGGEVLGGYPTYQAAEQAWDEATYIDSSGFLQWA